MRLGIGALSLSQLSVDEGSDEFSRLFTFHFGSLSPEVPFQVRPTEFPQ
jgi:hypothetical protein